jgi:general secretion pathway protein A
LVPIKIVQMTPPDYEAFFRISQRPFSLTPDPKFYFRSRSHGRVFDTLSTAIARRDSLMLVVGDLGVGKTTLCRTLMESPPRTSRSALVGNALLSPEDLLRLMLQDLGAIPNDAARQGTLGHATRTELVQQVDQFLGELHAANDNALMIIDEAQTLPPATMEQIVEIAGLDSNRPKVLQFLLAGQPTAGGGGTMPRLVDERLTVRARLLPLERDESERYVHHRLTIAGAAAVTFSAPAIETIYALSGGLPRLVNLLCERALQEAAAAQVTRIETAMIESAASALDLLRTRPKRFRWFATR